MIDSLCLAADSTIQAALRCIEANGRGIALIVDADKQLLGTVVDGDIRRAVLAGLAMHMPVTTLLEHKPDAYKLPVTAPITTSHEDIAHLMRVHQVRQIPLLDEQQRVVGLITQDELMSDLPVKAVVMAGGFGKRLYPLTEHLPKPMLPVGDKPIMEHIIEGLRSAGIKRVSVTTHFMPEKIKAHFGSGSDFGVAINYIAEDQPLGTAGGVGLLDPIEEPLLVINGDILTGLNFRDMVAYHQETQAALTVALRPYHISVPYGVVETAQGYVQSLVEKPVYTFYVNAGIYLLSPLAHRLIPRGERMDMTDLIEQLLAAKQPVASFPLREYWLDIGQPGDYARAQAEIGQVKK
jgi:dTDP-glucose pyrophosphorylase/CBS domain-containing protein